ncbi:MAG: hypothetical protein WC619_00930 [Patescibacteria group bacterium]
MKRLTLFLAIFLAMFVTIPISATALTSPPAATISNSTFESMQIAGTNGTVGATLDNLATIDNVSIVDNVMAQSATVTIGDNVTSVNMATNGATTDGIGVQNNKLNTEGKTNANNKMSSAVFTANLTTTNPATFDANNTSGSINQKSNTRTGNAIYTNIAVALPSNNTNVNNAIAVAVRTVQSTQVMALGTFYDVSSAVGTFSPGGECVAVATAKLKAPTNSATVYNTFSVTSPSAVYHKEGRAYAEDVVTGAEGFNLDNVTNSTAANTGTEAATGNTLTVYALNTSDATTRPATPINSDITLGIAADGLARNAA